MRSLQSISLEEIRKNWNTSIGKDINLEIYNMLWDDLILKFNINKECVYFKLFRLFIDKKQFLNEKICRLDNENEMCIFKLDNKEMKELHKLCDNIGLYNESSCHFKKRQLHIFYPLNNEWKFEFTPRNPYSESKKIYSMRKEELIDDNYLDILSNSNG
jgi:hypothetical protein